MARRLILVRHARIAAAQVGRLIGASDVPLDPLGESQARALAGRAARWSPGRCYTSPMLRCRQTAAAIFPGDEPTTPLSHSMGEGRLIATSDESLLPLSSYTTSATDSSQQLFIDDDLREIDFGRSEGRTFDEAAREDPTLAQRWAAFEPDFAFPGGERLGDFLARVHRATDRMAADDATTVMAVTHKGVIRVMICHLLGLEPWQYVLFDVGYAGSVTIDLFDGKGVLAALERLELPEACDG